MEILRNSIKNYKNILKEIEQCLDEIENEPQLILTKLMSSTEKNRIILNILGDLNGDESLFVFQESIMDKIVTYLSMNLNYDLTYLYNKETFPSYIEVKTTLNSITIALVDIYNRNIILLPDEEAEEINVKIVELEKQIGELEEEISKLEEIQKNPLISAGGNPVKIADVLIRKKKFNKKLIEEYQDLGDELISVKQELSSMKIQLQQRQESFLEIENIQERIGKRFNTLFDYNVINNDEQIIDVNKDDLTEENNLNYENKLYAGVEEATEFKPL